jgi:hypothetical protein
MRKRTLAEEDDFVIDDDGRGYADYGKLSPFLTPGRNEWDEKDAHKSDDESKQRNDASQNQLSLP